jgi:hypothetical protein
MQKKPRSRNRTSDAYKKRRASAPIGAKPVPREKPLAPKEYAKFLETLPRAAKDFGEKITAIARLAINERDSRRVGAQWFITLCGRRALKPLYKESYPNPSERRAALIESLAEHHLKNRLIEINEWLENKGHPELQLTFDELIDMILN